MSVVTTPAILLRSYPYSESSLVLRYLGEDLGLVSAIAKGARRRGKGGGGGYETFSEGTLTLYLKETRALQTVKDFVVSRSHLGLGRHPLRFGGATLLAELILRHAQQESSPVLFARVRGGLAALENAPAEMLLPRLLAEAWALVVHLGYAPELETCVRCGRALGNEEIGRFDYGSGGVRCASCAGEAEGPRVGPGARTQLALLATGETPGDFSHGGTHLRILGDFVTFHVSGGHPLRSIDFLLGSVEEG